MRQRGMLIRLAALSAAFCVLAVGCGGGGGGGGGAAPVTPAVGSGQKMIDGIYASAESGKEVALA